VGKKKKSLDPDAPAVQAEDLADDGSKRLLIGFAAVLFLAGFVVAVIAVLYRPERVVLVGMDAHETAWLSRAMKEYAEHHHANLRFVAYRDAAHFDSLLAADRASGRHKIVLAETPLERLAALADSNAVIPLREMKGVGDLGALLTGFTDEAVGPTRVAGRICYLPSRVTTLCLAYSSARVADAVAHGEEMRSLVEGWLRQANGTGLPADFHLEADPAEWDSYDLLVVAAYWANQPFIDGTAPRVAHAVAPTNALGFDLAARAFSMGSDVDEVLALDGFGVRDALAWESLWFQHGLYDPRMIEAHWTPEDIAREMAAGRIWLAQLEPSTVLRLHGLAADSASAAPEAPRAADIALSRLPRGVSLELKNKFPQRSGDPWSARGGFWWGVPRTSPDPKLAIGIVRAMTTPEFQAEAMRTLGWMPTRKELVDGLGNIFTVKGEYDLARQAVRQLYPFGRPLPSSARWPAASAALARAWEDACVTRRATAPIDLAETLRRSQGAPR
jgi:hypothetical protein